MTARASSAGCRAQSRYQAPEAEKLATRPWSELSWPDRLRCTRVLGPIAVAVHCLFVKGLIFDGTAGLFYTAQRVTADLILSMHLLRARPVGKPMTYVLGLNAYHADAAACLVKDGDLVAAVEEERFRRIKHWGGFPSEAIRYCLAEAGIALADVEHVAVNSDNAPIAGASSPSADLGRRPELRAGAPAPARRTGRRRRQPASARCRTRSSAAPCTPSSITSPSGLGVPGVAVRQGRGGLGRRLRRFRRRPRGAWARAACSRSTAGSTSRIRSACSTRR